MNKDIYLVSLGCSKNLVDSENIIGNLHERGYQLCFDETQAGIFMINTCGFIGPARDEGYAVIEEALAWKQANNGVVVVVGCLAQKETDNLNSKYPDVDVISGFGGYNTLDESITKAAGGTIARTTDTNAYDVPEAKTPIRLTGGASAYMKLGEGCTKRCAFCAIPHIRGNQRSVPLDQLIRRAEQLANEGVREIILIAQDPVTYGKDLDGDYTLFTALDALEKVDGIDWVRLHYLYPGPVANRVVKRMMEGGTKLLPYIDIPVQHADTDILRLMNRPAMESTWETLAQARQSLEDVIIRTTFLVGFPGEEEKHVNTLLKFMDTIRFDRVGTFTYSPEVGTPAFDLPGAVAESDMVRRRDQVMQRAQEISTELNEAKVDSIQHIIIDMPAQGETPAIGRTKGQSPDVDGITFVQGEDLNPGDIVEGHIVAFNEYDLIAQFN